MRVDSFVLEGCSYYAEKRTCGKQDCKCADGELHGPYWYRRNDMGIVKYIGKTLPDELLRIAATRAKMDAAIEAEQKRIADEIAYLRSIHSALDRLKYNQSLTNDQRQVIDRMGFGDCLVPPGGVDRKQEEARS